MGGTVRGGDGEDEDEGEGEGEGLGNRGRIVVFPRHRLGRLQF
jgi:hypothetical protein